MTKIALVVLDTLRKDAFDDHFDWLPGTTFENAYATSHYTVPSHASLFTGLYPSETGTNAKSHFFDPADPPLAKVLRENGFDTYAFSANVQISRQFGWDRGFDKYDGSWKSKHANATSDVFHWNSFIRQHRHEGPQRYAKALWRCIREDCATIPSLKHGLEIKYRTHTSADDGASEARSLIERRDFADDSFLFVNLMEAHKPYRPPEEYRTVDHDDEPDFDETVSSEPVSEEAGARSEQAYQDSVRYLSDVYKDIFDALVETFDYVFTLSDHGELFGEHGVWGHGVGLYPELTHVPLSIWGTDGDDVRTDTVSLLDIHRTILALADADAEYEGRGRDLREPVGERTALTEYLGLNMWRKETIEDADTDVYSTYETELYGIATPKDYYGYEDFDGFVESGTSTFDSPWDELRDCVDELQQRDGAQDTDDVPESVMNSLRDLGYV